MLVNLYATYVKERVTENKQLLPIHINLYQTHTNLYTNVTPTSIQKPF